MTDVQFSVELFFCCSTVDCLHLHFRPIVLLCVFGNEMEMGITQWEYHGNWNTAYTWHEKAWNVN